MEITYGGRNSGKRFEIIKRVYEELHSIDYKSSAEKMEIANNLCQKAGILVSDLILFEQQRRNKNNYMAYCSDCGCKMYNGACTNCHEEIYIAEQHMELGTWDQCSDEFKNKVVEKENEVANKPARN